MTSYFLLVTLVVLFYTNEIFAKVAPDFITPCPGLKSDCLKKEIQKGIKEFAKGIPSLGVVPLDPLYQKYVAFQLPGDMKIELFEGNLHNLGKCKVDSVSYKDDVAKLQLNCNLTYKGKYKAKGTILIVSLDGDGDAKLNISNIKVNMNIGFHDVTRDGKVYYEIKNNDVKYSIEGRVTFSLTNLFQGNPELSQTVNTFLNENWKPISDEFGKPIFNNIFELVYEGAVKKFFKSVPKNEIIVD